MSWLDCPSRAVAALPLGVLLQPFRLRPLTLTLGHWLVFLFACLSSRKHTMVEPITIGESLYWAYANLAMMEAVLKDGIARPGPKHFAIRSRLYAGLCRGAMEVRGFFDDEKLKLHLPKACWYCGSDGALSVDHIVPQATGGKHGGENLIYSCRRCNSSKGSKDLLVWMKGRGEFPPLYLLRRYLKMAIEYCRQQGLMAHPFADLERIAEDRPFALALIPHRFPPASELSLWIGERKLPASQAE